MDCLTPVVVASFETTVFFDHFKDMPDRRQPGKVAYRLDEVLLLALLSILAGAEGFTDMARFGQKKLPLLRRFLPFANGTPSHDHLGDIFASLDPQAFRECFVAWVGGLTKAPRDVIAHRRQDLAALGAQGRQGDDPQGVGLRGPPTSRVGANQGEREVQRDRRHSCAARHAVDRGRVTIDAMVCQRKIAQTIVDKKADFVLALKGNQGTLRDDVELFATEQKAKGFADTTISVDQTVDGDHCRIETRRVTVVHDVAWLQERHQWPSLKGVVIVDSQREIGPKTERETSCYVTSSNLRADKLGVGVRDHWAIENSLHRVMDMTFRDDKCRIRTENAPENVVTLKHMATNLARRKKGKDPVRLTLKTAAWDDDYLAKLIAA